MRISTNRIPFATNLYRVLFLVMSSVLLLAAASSTLFWGNTFPMAFYFLAIVGAATFWAAFTLRTGEKTSWTNQETALALFMVLLTFAAFVTRFYHLGEVAPWCDEDWHNMRLPRGSDIVDLAAWINQPPAHYYLAKFSMEILGRSLFAIRLFPALFSALSVPLFFSFLRKTCASAKYAIAGSLALLVSIWLVSYAKEAKPYSGGIFFFLLFLHAFFDFLQAPREHKRWTSVVITGVLTLLALGLQPVLLLFGCAVAFGAYYLGKRDIRTALLAGSALLVAALLFAPFQIYLLRSSLERNGFVKHVSLLYFLRNELAANTQSNLQAYLLMMKNGLFFLAPLLTIALLYRLRFFRRTPRSASDAMQIGLLGVAHLFPLLFFFAYGLVVNSPLEPRYLLLYIPIFIAGAAYSLETAETRLRRGLPRSAPEVSVGFALGLALLTLPYIYLSSRDRSQKPVEFKWANFYQYVREHDELKNAAGFIFTINHPPRFSLDGFIHTDFFYTEALRKKIQISSEWDVFSAKTQVQQILERLESGLEPSHILFFYLNQETEAPLAGYKFPPELDPEIVPFRENEIAPGPWDAAMVRIKNKFGFAGTLERFFREMERQEKNEDFKIKINSVLMGIHLVKKECVPARAYFGKLARCADPTSRYRDLEPVCRDFEYLRDRLKTECGP